VIQAVSIPAADEFAVYESALNDSKLDDSVMMTLDCHVCEFARLETRLPCQRSDRGCCKLGPL
jgi:hypothetical protein